MTVLSVKSTTEVQPISIVYFASRGVCASKGDGVN